MSQKTHISRKIPTSDLSEYLFTNIRNYTQAVRKGPRRAMKDTGAAGRRFPDSPRVHVQ